MTQSVETVDARLAAQSQKTGAIMQRFNDAFQRHDPAVFAELVAEDCVIENTTPAPDGERRVGREACVGLWRAIATTPGTRFDLEEVFVAGDRAIIRWRYWQGAEASVRGVNLMRVEGDRIVQAMGYVKSP
jgi:ketosteroid isomerase-like protein